MTYLCAYHVLMSLPVPLIHVHMLLMLDHKAKQILRCQQILLQLFQL